MFAQHFSCGSSVTGEDEVVIQGDVWEDILEFIPEKWPEVYVHAWFRVSNLKYESVRIDSETVVFIRANPGKKETTEGLDSNVNFIRKQCTFPEMVSPAKWYVTNI